jgi:hypothetical protein
MQVKELRKPSLSAWTVNQLARRNRKDVDLLLDAGHRLVAAQAEVVSGGDPARFDEAREREQTAVRKLRQAARTILADRSASGTIERVSTTLRAAAVSEPGRELLARGRLTGDVEASGFEAFAGIAPSAKPAPGSKAKLKRRDETTRRAELAEARAALKAAREEEAEATQRLRRAEKALGQARRELDEAAAAVTDAEADRDAAAERTQAAEEALDEARKAR